MVVISDLFTETNLAASEEYGFSKSLNHVGLANLFAHVAENYCTMVLEKTYEECNPEPEKGCGHNDDCTAGEQICVDRPDTEKGFECTYQSTFILHISVVL